MSFGEVLTKLAVILTCYSAVKGEMWSVPLAWKIGGTLVIASFIRDASIRAREAIRLAPGFGFWFLATAVIVCVPNAVLKKLIGLESWGFSYWESIAASGIIAMFFRGFMIVCESISRWTIWFLGWDNKRVDAAHRYYQQQRREWLFGPSQPQQEYWHDDSGQTWPVVDGEVIEPPTISNDRRGRLN
jgi:hypothetical protein